MSFPPPAFAEGRLQRESIHEKQMKNLTLAIDYDALFKNRMIILSGLSSSGTGILYRIVGSFQDVVPLFQPTIIRYIPTLAYKKIISVSLASQLLKGILFEDYYLQHIHGRKLNFKEIDMSYIGNFEDISSIKERWEKYQRRLDVIPDLNKGKYTFAFKISELQPIYFLFDRIFEGVKIIELVRNGNDLIGSSLRRGWYTDDYLNHSQEEWIRPGKVKIPWHIDRKHEKSFSGWNPPTRVAHLWRTMTEAGFRYHQKRSNYLRIKYEDLLREPEEITKRCEDFLGLKRTDITVKNIKDIQQHSVRRYDNVIDQIDKEEAAPFIKMMKKLNYL